MKESVRAVACAAVLSGCWLAGAQGPMRRAAVSKMPAGKVRRANVVGYISHRTGKLHLLDGHQRVRDSLVAFDNLSAPPQDPNLGLNIAALSPVDPNTGGVDLLCKYPVSPDFAYFGSLTNGDEDCPVAQQGPSYPGIINDPQDIIFDKYLMDTSVVAADPNDTVALSGITTQVVYDGGDTGYVLFPIWMAEANDTNGNGAYDVIDGITIVTHWDPNTPAGLYTIPLTLDPNAPLLANVRGRRNWDVGNERYADVTLTMPIGPACSFGSMMVGGNPQEFPSSDPNCATPQDLVTVGRVDEPNIIYPNTTDGWQWFNHTEFEPNCVADPSHITIGDILNCGIDGSWVFYYPGGNELDIAPDIPNTFYVEPAGYSCAGDASGDGATNITDLGIVLNHFGDGPGAAKTDGDVSYDGFVNITDLGIILGDFGCSS